MTKSESGASPKVSPILFSAPMVRALLKGRKTQTRRVIRTDILPILPGEPGHMEVIDGCKVAYKYRVKWDGEDYQYERSTADLSLACPYGQPGDLLWVRETWHQIPGNARVIVHRASCENGSEHNYKWRSSLHMPRWASRLTLELTDVRIQRLQALSEYDAKAEGLIAQLGDGSGPGGGYKWHGYGYHGVTVGKFGPSFHVPDKRGRCSCCVGETGPARCAFREIWESLNGPGSWGKNPWVWALAFNAHQQNIDALLADRVAA